MNNTCCVILAAGEGKRMKSDLPKVLLPVLFKPMLKWVVDAAYNSGIDNICVVTGYKHELLEEYLSSVKPVCETVIQSERKGSAHAAMMADEFLRKHSGGDVLILGGDAPLINTDTIKQAYDLHKSEGNAVTVVSAKLDNPFGYGRIVRDSETNNMVSIIEQKDASEEVKSIQEVNSGVYWFNIDALLSVLYNISNDTAQGEYYLPDAIKLLLARELKVNAFVSSDADTVLGANDCMQLNSLNAIARMKVLNALMQSGVSIPCTDGIVIGPDVKINNNTYILPSTIIKGDSSVGKGCMIGPNSQIIGCDIGDNVTINSSVCVHSNIKSGENIGPFAYIADK